METLKFLIAGNGFIGSNVRNQLIARGNEVKTLDIDGNPDYKFSIADRDKFNDIRERFDGLFLFAATTSPPEFEIYADRGFMTNADGAFNVLEFARNNGIGRVVLASSSAIYGNNNSISKEDDILPHAYDSIYPITKIIDEHLAGYYSVRKEMDVIPLRYFNTYGCNENIKGMYSSQVYKFIKYAMDSEDIIIYGDENQSRDFIYVKDNARATILAFKNGRPGQPYNVGTGITTRFNDVGNMVIDIVNNDVKIKHIDNPLKSYQLFTQADITKTRKELKFEPEYSLKRGIREIYETEKN